MPRRITARFAVRREAELAVEHLVQDYGLDRSAGEVTTEGSENTAGTVPSGADTDPATGEPEASARHGMIIVSAMVEDTVADKAEKAMREAGAQ
jgi:hypothetical protein